MSTPQSIASAAPGRRVGQATRLKPIGVLVAIFASTVVLALITPSPSLRFKGSAPTSASVPQVHRLGR